MTKWNHEYVLHSLCSILFWSNISVYKNKHSLNHHSNIFLFCLTRLLELLQPLRSLMFINVSDLAIKSLKTFHIFLNSNIHKKKKKNHLTTDKLNLDIRRRNLCLFHICNYIRNQSTFCMISFEGSANYHWRGWHIFCIFVTMPRYVKQIVVDNVNNI